MDTFLFSGFAGAYLLLLLVGVRLAQRHGWTTPANVVLLVIAGLVYDNTVIALGRFIGVGPQLEAFNLARFAMHAFLTPLLLAFAWKAVVRAGVGWARAPAVRYVVGAMTLVLVVLELTTEVFGLDLTPHREYGVLSYTDAAGSAGPPLMPLLVAVALLVAGVLVLRAQRWPWFLVGAALMTVGSAIPLPVASGAVTNAFELVLLASVLATKWYQDVQDAPGRTPRTRAG